jgi:hypothetical protein
MATLAGKQHGNFRHGMIGTPTYESYKGMIERCSNPNASNYKWYGGKGIKVCPEWRMDFRNFFADMGTRPAGKTIDRIDGAGDYTPANCKWSSQKEQVANSSTPQWITFEGITLCISEWAVRMDISIKTLWKRLNKLGWSVERSLTEPIHNVGSHLIKQVSQGYHRVVTKRSLFRSISLRRLVLQRSLG